MKNPFLEKKYSGWYACKGVRVITNFSNKLSNNLHDLIIQLIVNSEIKDVHKISYWKQRDDYQLIGIFILKQRWGSQITPKFQQFDQKLAFTYEVERYNMVDVLKNEKSIQENSDIIINDLEIDENNQKQKKQVTKLQNKLKRQKKERKKRRMITNNQQDESLNQVTSSSQLVVDAFDEQEKMSKKIISQEGNEFVQGWCSKCPIKFLLTPLTLYKLWKSKKENADLFGNKQLIKIQKQLISCNQGQQLTQRAFQKYVSLLSEKYATNKKVKIIENESLTYFFQEGQPDTNKIQEKQTSNNSEKQLNLLFPFLYNNHASLIIFNQVKNNVYHVDSWMKNKQHIFILKFKLWDYLAKFSLKQKQDIDQTVFWNSIEIIECPAQEFDQDSTVFCLRNIHEFLREDKILIDLENAYLSYEIASYRDFIGACILYDEYLSSY